MIRLKFFVINKEFGSQKSLTFNASYIMSLHLHQNFHFLGSSLFQVNVKIKISYFRIHLLGYASDLRSRSGSVTVDVTITQRRSTAMKEWTTFFSLSVQVP